MSTRHQVYTSIRVRVHTRYIRYIRYRRNGLPLALAHQSQNVQERSRNTSQIYSELEPAEEPYAGLRTKQQIADPNMPTRCIRRRIHHSAGVCHPNECMAGSRCCFCGYCCRNRHGTGMVWYDTRSYDTIVGAQYIVLLAL